MADDGDNYPGAETARGGASPTAFIMHHTAGRGTPEGVVSWWKKQGRGYGAQYIMDRDGVIHDTAKEFGYTGSNQILNGTGVGKGLNNGNVVGMEIIAKNDADVTPAQAAAAAKFIQARYPNLPVYGHGQVNAGHKEDTEGSTAVAAVNALRSPDGVDTGTMVAGNKPAFTSYKVAGLTQPPPAGSTTINAARASVPGALAKPEVGPEGAGGNAATAASTGPLDTRQLVYNKLVAAGLQPHQALGAVWSLAGESGKGLNPGAYNPNDPGGAVGIGQWNGPRRAALESFAKARGTAVTDPGTQADFLVDELTNKNAATYQPGVFAKMQGAGNAADATKVWTTQFERPKIDNSAARIKNGVNVASLDANGNFALGAGGGGAPAATAVASTAPAATAPAPAPAPADQPWWAKFTAPTTDPKTGKLADSPLQQVAESVLPGSHGQSAKEMMEEQAPEKSALSSAGPGARNISPGLQNIAQTYGQTINSFSQPLTWSNAPPRLAGMAPAGFQPSQSSVPGMSLNSFQTPSTGLGYGIEPIGYGYG